MRSPRQRCSARAWPAPVRRLVPGARPGPGRRRLLFVQKEEARRRYAFGAFGAASARAAPSLPHSCHHAATPTGPPARPASATGTEAQRPCGVTGGVTGPATGAPRRGDVDGRHDRRAACLQQPRRQGRRPSRPSSPKLFPSSSQDQQRLGTGVAYRGADRRLELHETEPSVLPFSFRSSVISLLETALCRHRTRNSAAHLAATRDAAAPGRAEPAEPLF